MIPPDLLTEICLTYARTLENVGAAPRQRDNFQAHVAIIAKGMENSVGCILEAAAQHGFIHRDRIMVALEKRRDKFPEGSPERKAFADYVAVLRGAK